MGWQNELYNVDRVSKSEGLDGLPSDYSKLPKVPELGPPLPGDLGPAIVAAQQPTYMPPGHDPNDALRKEAEAAAASAVFFRSGQQGKAAAPGAAQVAAASPGSALAGFDPLAAGSASTAAQPTLTARPGLPVRIIASRDLVLRPYQPLFLQRGGMQ